jgi:hypothetical protein
MRFNRIFTSAFITLFLLCISTISSAQIGGVNALVKGSVTTTSGGIPDGVSITAYQGTEQIRTTKSTPEGKFTIVLKPGNQYRVTFASAKYYYHEEQLSIPASDKYQEVPMQVSLKELETGRPFTFSNLIFEPKSSNISQNVLGDLESIASAMKHNPKLSLVGTVYPDETPTGKRAKEQNALAASRKSALVAFFAAKNISPSSISIDISTSVPANGTFERMISVDQSSSTKSKKKKKAPATSALKKIMVPQYAQLTMQAPS